VLRATVTSRSPEIILLMRAGAPGCYSIERLFGNLAPALAERFNVRVVHVPYPSMGAIRCIRNLIFTARLRADVIHVTGDIHYCALAVPRRRCVLTIHDLCSLRRLTGLRRRAFSLLWYGLPLRWARHVTAISDETKQQLESAFPAVRGKVTLVPNCVDKAFETSFRRNRAAAGIPQVLQVGTGWNKNLGRAARACSGLPLRLRIIGRLSPEQRTMLAASGVNWSFAADLPAEDLLGEYCSSSALIFVSTYEGFGLPIVEAQAAGIPVITSRISPMIETSGGAALLVDPHSEQEIRAALMELLSSATLAQRLDAAGRRNAERFSVAVVAQEYADIYYRTLGQSVLVTRNHESPV
jgi:glycosyltransferase involved in cell wall biosynthesis